jgi:hypothetical protein
MSTYLLGPIRPKSLMLKITAQKMLHINVFFPEKYKTSYIWIVSTKSLFDLQ